MEQTHVRYYETAERNFIHCCPVVRAITKRDDEAQTFVNKRFWAAESVPAANLVSSSAI